MDISKVHAGDKAPWETNVIIEIPCGGPPVKYEIDKHTGALFVDRFIHTAMHYPANYGYIPATLAADGDPIDALVIGEMPVVPGAVIRTRPIGVLYMEDEGGKDEKIVMVPINKVSTYYSGISSYQDLPPLLCQQITHFFEHYKDLERHKWVKTAGWGSADEAAKLITAGIKLFRNGEDTYEDEGGNEDQTE